MLFEREYIWASTSFLIILRRRHSSEIVSTVYCHQLDNALYGFYAVAVTKNCVHTMTTKKFRIQSSKPEEVWRSHRMHVWVNQLSGKD